MLLDASSEFLCSLLAAFLALLEICGREYGLGAIDDTKYQRFLEINYISFGP